MMKRIMKIIRNVNYDYIVKKYVDGFIKYSNNETTSLKVLQKKLNTTNKTFIFPVENVAIFHNVSLNILDGFAKYSLPKEIEKYRDELLYSHKSSNVYNQLNIRVNDWVLKDNVFTMHTSRTTYFDSLVTNRSMDVKLSNGCTLRELYQYGPFIQSLKDSKLSNHIGFNGFIVSSDGYIPFIKRNKLVSIGKNTYGNSVSSSLKVKYALKDENSILTEEGIINAFKKEIKDELKIEEKDIGTITIKDNLIAAYRDFVEGGKPQFLIYVKVGKTKKEIEEQFYSKIKQKDKVELKFSKELKGLEDGEKLIWVKESELSNMAISPSLVVFKDGNKYRKLYMMPSVTSSIVMLLEWLGNKKDNSYC